MPSSHQKLMIKDQGEVEELTRNFEKLKVKDAKQKSHERSLGQGVEVFDLETEDESQDSQSEPDEDVPSSDEEVEKMANTACNQEKQGLISLPAGWKVHPMWRQESKMEIQMCSIGIETLEENLDPGKQWDKMNKKCKVYHYIGNNLNWSSKMFKVEKGEHRDLFISQLKKAHPDYKDWQILPIDSREWMGDPNEQKKDKHNLRNHTGRNPALLHRLAWNENLESLMTDFIRKVEEVWTADCITPLLVVFVCKKGKHRSETAKEVFSVACQECNLNSVQRFFSCSESTWSDNPQGCTALHA